MAYDPSNILNLSGDHNTKDLTSIHYPAGFNSPRPFVDGVRKETVSLSESTIQNGSFDELSLEPDAQNLEPVAPLQATANRWDRKAIQVDTDSPQMVDRKVKGLLNKLTMEKFDSISDQIITWANKSEKEKDGRTLIQVIRLLFEKATNEHTRTTMYARLCRKMMEQISPKVQDDGIKNNEGKPIAGGQLFRKYLLNRCQEDFERGWVAKEATAAAAASKALEDKAIKAARDKDKADGKEEEVALCSNEYYAAQKAKRQGLGLIKFIGELFKFHMLTERIMHECVKKLLGNVDNPEEEEIESLCMLLGTVGGILDTPKARAHVDAYFTRMRELIKSPNVTPCMQYILEDLVELRERNWVPHTAVAAPTTIAAIRENAAKEKAAAVKKSYQRQISIMTSSSAPPGDQFNFGKISKAQPMAFGPSSVFAGKKGAENKQESIFRPNSTSNKWSILGAKSSEPVTKPTEPAQRKRLVLQPRSKPLQSESAQTEHLLNFAVAQPAQGKRLVLQSRSKHVESESAEAETTSPVTGSESESDEEAAVETAMSEADALKKIKEGLKEFFAVRNLEKAEVYFKIPAQHHHTLVDKFVSSAVESKEADAKLVSDFFDIAVSKDLCTAQAFEDGFTPIAEIIDDIAIDAPKAFQFFALMIKGAKLDGDRRQRLASKSMDSEKLLALLVPSVVSNVRVTSPPKIDMSPAEARKRILQYSREFFAVRNMQSARAYFMIPACYHDLLVEQLTLTALLNQRNRADAEMVSNLFKIAVSNNICASSSFDNAFSYIATVIDDLSLDIPHAVELFALIAKGALQPNNRQRTRPMA